LEERAGSTKRELKNGRCDFFQSELKYCQAYMRNCHVVSNLARNGLRMRKQARTTNAESRSLEAKNIGVGE
jgi:hypothetical protein